MFQKVLSFPNFEVSFFYNQKQLHISVMSMKNVPSTHLAKTDTFEALKEKNKCHESACIRNYFLGH